MSGNLPGSSNALQVTIPAIVFCVVSPLFVGIRFWSRLRVSNVFGVDDWTILGSLISSLAVSILMLASAHYGFGKHIKSLTQPNKLMALKLFYIAQAFYKLNINMTKASILLLYLRIFVQRTFRILCWIMLGIVTAYGISSTASAIFQCTPIPRAWDKSIPGTCINITTNWYANAGFSISTDIIILLLPMPLIYSLRLPTNQRLALMFLFALGSFVIVTSCMRMTTLNLSSTSPDTTYDITSSLWTLIEANVGIICACLPMCRLPLTLLFPSIFPSHNAYGANTSSPHAGTTKNEWIPPSNKSQDIQLASVNVAADNNSEEYILQKQTEESKRGERPNTIRKVTHFSIEYGSRKDRSEK